MNNITFTGRREVVYGLEKAAVFSKKTEKNKAALIGPRPNLFNRDALAKDMLSIHNYLDMATYDDAFVNTISHYEQKDLNSLANLLKPFYVQNSEYNPINIFKQILTEASNNNILSEERQKILDFIKNIKSLF